MVVTVSQSTGLALFLYMCNIFQHFLGVLSVALKIIYWKYCESWALKSAWLSAQSEAILHWRHVCELTWRRALWTMESRFIQCGILWGTQECNLCMEYVHKMYFIMQGSFELLLSDCSLNNAIQVKNYFILELEQTFYEMHLFQKHMQIMLMLKIQFRAFEA